MTTRLRLDGPDTSELPKLVDDLLTEVDGALSAPGWVLVKSASRANLHVHAAAALRHVCGLLGEVLPAAVGHREIALRVLGRAHLEAWFVGMYIAMGGAEALADVASDYQYSMKAQHRDLLAYNERLKRDREEAAGSNRKIGKINDGIRIWNAAHPAIQKPLVDTEPVPTSNPIEQDLLSALSSDAGDISRMALPAVIARLNELASSEEGVKGGFDAAYALAYRGLSSLGAHPTLWVLNSYIDSPVRSIMLRTSRTMSAPSMADAVLHTALLQTAALTQRVLGLRNTPAPVADAVAGRYHLSDEAGKESVTSSCNSGDR